MIIRYIDKVGKVTSKNLANIECSILIALHIKLAKQQRVENLYFIPLPISTDFYLRILKDPTILIPDDMNLGQGL